MYREFVRETEFGTFTLRLRTTERGHSVVTDNEAEVISYINDTLDLLKVGYTQYCEANEVKREG